MTVQGGDDGAFTSSMGQRRRRPEPSPTQRALELLTRREHSQQELARKLAQRGVAADVAQTVIGQLHDAGWQSNDRFAEVLLRSRAANGYGPAYIRAELASHGLSREAISSTMDGFDGDWVENARDLLRRRHPQALTGDLAARRKAADALLRRGYAMDCIRTAMTPDAA